MPCLLFLPPSSAASNLNNHVSSFLSSCVSSNNDSPPPFFLLPPPPFPPHGAWTKAESRRMAPRFSGPSFRARARARFLRLFLSFSPPSFTLKERHILFDQSLSVLMEAPLHPFSLPLLPPTNLNEYCRSFSFFFRCRRSLALVVVFSSPLFSPSR